MKNLKSIEFIFENCETMIIPAERIGDIFIGDLDTHIHRIACNCISKVTVAKEIFIEIFNMNSEDKTLKRFEISDIASIQLNYETEGNIEDFDIYYVEYDEPQGQEGYVGAENINQQSYVSSLNNIYILISKNNKIETYIDKDKINDKEDVEFRYNILDAKESPIDNSGLFSDYSTENEK